MSIRKLIPLAGLVLALAALTPASVPAKNGGTHKRPMKGAISGTSTTTPTSPTTGELTHDVIGVGTHLGKFTRHVEGTYEVTGSEPTTLAGKGRFIVVAANGDKLCGRFRFTGVLSSPTTRTSTVYGRFTGGTGRFADAHGFVKEEDVVTNSHIEGTFRGWISY
jgi:hypothetical protein